MPSKKGSKWIKNPEDSILRWEYYKKQDPTRTQEECELLALKRRKARNKGSIEYYELHFLDISHEERLRMLKEFQENYNKNQPTHLEYYQKHYPNLTPEEQNEMYKKYMRSTNGGCIEYYERKYPDKTPEERQVMLQNWIDTHQSMQPRLVGESNPGHSKNTTALERKQRSPKCIEFYELRYPDKSHEEHLIMLEEHKKLVKQKLQDPKNQVLCIEYWLAKGYSMDDAEKHLTEEYQKRSFTLEKCIKKYGEKEGKKKFEERQIKWQKSLHDKFNSSKIPQSELAKNIINKIKRKFPSLETEFRLKFYSFDIKYKNILIEINGDYWHMNPKLYNINDKNKVVGKNASEIWLKDKHKKECAESYGYKVFVIWESEFNNDSSNTIKNCIKFIHDNVSN